MDAPLVFYFILAFVFRENQVNFNFYKKCDETRWATDHM